MDLTRRATSIIAFACFAALTACGGVAGSPVALPDQASSKTATAVLQITGPAAPLQGRTAEYLSPRIESVEVSGAGLVGGLPLVVNVTPGSPGCSGYPVECTIPIAANVGSAEMFTVTAFSGANALGEQLAIGSVDMPVTAGLTNTISVTLDPTTAFTVSEAAAAFARNGSNMLVALNPGGGGTPQIIVFNPVTGATTTSFSISSSIGIQSLTIGAGGAPWFTDFVNGAVGSIVGGTAVEYPGVPRASGIVLGPDGNMWATSVANFLAQPNTGSIVVLSPNGTILHSFGGTLPNPGAIALGPDGNLWFTEYGAVAKITPGGVITQYAASGSNSGALVVGADGKLWFTTASAIANITTSGTITTFPLPTNVSGSVAIAPGANGDVWFTSSGSGSAPPSIGFVTPTGTYADYALDPHYIVESAPYLGPDGNMWYGAFGYVVRFDQ